MKTQPDGLYVIFGKDEFVDVIVVEVCRSLQNLHDKRSRYSPTTTSMLLEVPKAWINGEAHLQNNGRNVRWKACESFGAAAPSWSKMHRLPVRHLRVLYAVKDVIYDTWVKAAPPAGHEYYVRHSAFKGLFNGASKRFLERLAPSSHLHTQAYAI